MQVGESTPALGAFWAEHQGSSSRRSGAQRRGLTQTLREGFAVELETPKAEIHGHSRPSQTLSCRPHCRHSRLAEPSWGCSETGVFET